MNILQQLEQARADLAALEGDTAKLEANLRAQEAALDTARREARTGSGSFEAVVTAQSRQEAARGIIGQHLQDVANAHALVTELEAAVNVLTSLEEGQEARRIMRETAEAHSERAAQAEQALGAALEELRQLEQAHERARARLGAVLRKTVKAAHGVDPYADPGRMTHTPDAARVTGRTFLGEIDPDLSEAEALNPSGFGLRRFPLLAKARGDA